MGFYSVISILIIRLKTLLELIIIYMQISIEIRLSETHSFGKHIDI